MQNADDFDFLPHVSVEDDAFLKSIDRKGAHARQRRIVKPLLVSHFRLPGKELKGRLGGLEKPEPGLRTRTRGDIFCLKLDVAVRSRTNDNPGGHFSLLLGERRTSWRRFLSQ